MEFATGVVYGPYWSRNNFRATVARFSLVIALEREARYEEFIITAVFIPLITVQQAKSACEFCANHLNLTKSEWICLFAEIPGKQTRHENPALFFHQR